LNEEVVLQRNVTEAYIEKEKQAQISESKRRIKEYDGGRPYPKIRGKIAVVIDDGVATGATMIAALRWARKQEAKKVIVAVPVAPRDTLAKLRAECDDVICMYKQEIFFNVGGFYQEFGEVSDDEVIKILK